MGSGDWRKIALHCLLSDSAMIMEYCCSTTGTSHVGLIYSAISPSLSGGSATPLGWLTPLLFVFTETMELGCHKIVHMDLDLKDKAPSLLQWNLGI